MTAPDPGDELPVFIMGAASAPERLLLVGRPMGGRVRVREWSGADWGAPPAERELRCEELVQVVEGAVRAGQRVNQSPQTVRRWVDAARG